MIVDLRSDVLTKPTPEMLKAMFSASMGDDVFEEDATVKKLQEKVADLTGKEAALFVVSGTMANQLAIAAQTLPHDEIILDVNSHIFQFEQGAPAVNCGVQTRPISYTGGLPNGDELGRSFRGPDIHQPISRLLCLEITHNYDGGTIADIEKIRVISGIAHNAGLKIHTDGARVWNAVIASGLSIKEYASLADTMMFCFSKGLGAPIGSILVGPKDTIERARYLRKGFGGGWRQPGMLAAAALYALDHHIERLADDHRRAKRLAEAISANPNLELARRVDTNMVFFRPRNMAIETCSKKLTAQGVENDWEHFGAIRLVTYLNIDDEMIDYAIRQISTLS